MADFDLLRSVAEGSRVGPDAVDVKATVQQVRTRESRKSQRNEIKSEEEAAFKNLKMGARVTVTGYEGNGTIVFLGDHHENKRLRVGISMDDPVGKNNGTVKGHKYFDCADKHGLLTPPTKVTVIPGEVVYATGGDETFLGFDEGVESGFASPTSPTSTSAIYSTVQKGGPDDVPMEYNPEYGPLSPEMQLYDNPEAGSIDEISEDLYGATSASLGLKSVRVRTSFSLENKSPAFINEPAYQAHAKSCDKFRTSLQEEWDAVIQLNPSTPKEASKAKAKFNAIKASASKKHAALDALRTKAQGLDSISFDARQDGLEKVLLLQTSLGKFMDILESAEPIILDHEAREKHKAGVQAKVEKVKQSVVTCKAWAETTRKLAETDPASLKTLSSAKGLLDKVAKLQTEHARMQLQAQGLVEAIAEIVDATYHSEHSHWEFDGIDELKTSTAQVVETVEDAETDLEVAVIDFQDRLAELENEQSELEEAKQVKKGTQSNTSMLRVCDRHAEWAERELLRVPGLVEPVYSLTAAKKIATRHGKIKAAMVDRTAAVQRIEIQDVDNESKDITTTAREHALQALQALANELTAASGPVLDHVEQQEFAVGVEKTVAEHAALARSVDSWRRSVTAFCAKPHQISMPAQGAKLQSKLDSFRADLVEQDLKFKALTTLGEEISSARYESEFSTWRYAYVDELHELEHDVDTALSEVPAQISAKEKDLEHLIELAVQRLHELEAEEQAAREHKAERAHTTHLKKYLKWATPLATAFESVKVVSVSAAKKALAKHKKLSAAVEKKDGEVQVLAAKTAEMPQDLQGESLELQGAIAEAFRAARAQLNAVKPILDDHLQRENFAVKTRQQASKYRSVFSSLKKWATGCGVFLDKERKVLSSKQVTKLTKTLESYSKNLKSKNKKLMDATVRLEAVEQAKYESLLSTYQFEHAKKLREPHDALVKAFDELPSRIAAKHAAFSDMYKEAVANEFRIKQEKEARKAEKAAARKAK